MNQLTFIEKLQVLFKLLFSSPIIIGIFAFSMILMIVLFFYSKINKKIIKYVFCLLYISLIGFAVFKYGKYFLVGIDSFLTLFMANIYFPIIPVYVVIMFVSFIIMIFTLGSKRKSRVVKIINTVFFTIIQMLFALFIYIVESNNIDLSSNTGLYSNEQTMTLLELGMGLFFIWIVLLLVLLYLKKADRIFKVKTNDNTDDFDEYINDYNEPTSFTNPVINNDKALNNITDNVVQSNGVDITSTVNDLSNSLDVPIESSINNSLDINSSIPEFNVGIVDSFNPGNYMSESSNFIDNKNLEVNVSSNIGSKFEAVNSSNIVESFVPEKNIGVDDFSNNGSVIFENQPDSVESLDFADMDVEKSNSEKSNFTSNIFNNFNFLDFDNSRDRKDDDVEVIDFD